MTRWRETGTTAGERMPASGGRTGWSRRRLLGTAAATASGLLLPTRLAQPASAGWWAAVTADELNLRAEPGAWAEVLATAWGGEWVEIQDGPTADGWYWVAVDERAGWADGAFLSADGVGVGGAGSMMGWAGGGAERWVDVNRSSQTVTLFEGDVPQASSWGAMSSDASADGFYATAVGTWFVYEKVQGLSWTDFGGAFITDWVGFDPGRLNGFHSYLKDGEGWTIPGGDGPTGGCISLGPGADDQLFGFVDIGTRVEVHW